VLGRHRRRIGSRLMEEISLFFFLNLPSLVWFPFAPLFLMLGACIVDWCRWAFLFLFLFLTRSFALHLDCVGITPYSST
jgi:hypothetical protein